MNFNSFAQEIKYAVSLSINNTKLILESKLSEVQTSISQISAIVHQNEVEIDQLKSSAVSTDMKLAAGEKSFASLELAMNNCKDDVASIQQKLFDLKKVNKDKFLKQ